MGLKICHALFKAIMRLLYRVRVTGRENLPEGGALLCPNHTALFDPLFLVYLFKTKDLPYIMGKKELFKNKIFAAFFKWAHVFPVDRGTTDIHAIKTSLDVLRNGKKLLIFPEGTRVPEGGEAESKRGAVTLAYKVKAPIVPVYISPGRKTPFRRIEVIFGAPYLVDFQGEKPSPKLYASAARDVMARVAALGQHG